MAHVSEFRPGLWLVDVTLNEFDVRGAVIAGTERAVVWDTLSHPRDMSGVLPLLNRPWNAIVYSHADWDHVWGSAAITADAIIGHTITAERFGQDVPLRLQEKQDAEPYYWDAVRLYPPTWTFSQQLSLDLGGVTLELHHMGGHTSDCIVGWLPQWGILLIGDNAETPLPYLSEMSNVKQWISKLKQWADDTRVQTVIPSHGRIGGREILTGTLAYLLALERGEAPVIEGELKPFYAQTHADNLKWGISKGE
jgi:glyoxylase-like metal-dependent hydrolase (beta-lactamase superfamily II)